MPNINDMNESELYGFIKTNGKYVIDDNQDWMTVISGREGSGKSMMAAWMALTYDPTFDVKTQVIYDVDSFIKFIDLYGGDDKHPPQKGKVAWFDEACLHFLGEDSTTTEAKRFKKLFITHRDYGFIYLLCSPSPWLLTPYIRNWRVRDFVLVYVDAYAKGSPRNYSYYTKKAYAPMITSAKAKNQIMIPSDFVKVHKPTTVERFPKIQGIDFTSLFDTVFQMKKKAQKVMRDEISNIHEEVGHEDGLSYVQQLSSVKRGIAFTIYNKEGLLLNGKRLTKGDVAKMVGYSRETLSR
jgi:hypothetical protein